MKGTMNNHMTASAEGDGDDFQPRFGQLCLEVVLIFQQIQLEENRRGDLSLSIIDTPGPTTRNSANHFDNNRHVALQVNNVTPVRSLWFIAWSPKVIVQSRRNNCGFVKLHPLELITTDFIYDTVRQFFSTIRS